MNIIKSIYIKGLWGDERCEIEFPLDQNFNFLIGQNGTGKTTIINLIAAALNADFEKLDKIQFLKVLIKLQEIKGKKNPTIEILKNQKEGLPYYDIEYRIKRSSKDDAQIFDLDAVAEEQFYRGIPPRMLREKVIRERFLDIRRQLSELVNLCWLSIHRNNNLSINEEHKKNLSPIDYKLLELNNSFTRYFSQLNRKYGEHTLEFQKKVFLSLLTVNESRIKEFTKGINTETEKEDLASVFDLLGVEQNKYKQSLNIFVEKVQKAQSALENKTFDLTDFAVLYNAQKTHALVQYYEDLEKSKAEIFEPRDTFLSVVNELFDGRKVIGISERNDITVKTRDGKSIDLEDLSSGEKQLLIILGEALIQDKRSMIFIADEPELSLHIKWQEKLTSSISRLNPNAQIIFATHSPDIVSIYSNKVINMEALLS
ncbi:AAA family ATPase [Methylophilus sp. 14]|uniref:AAA family ATPase n=1 Tax=Methylophilus sp. 14 TaxID=2781019 RepID=UPI00188F9BAB|nr:AAA family ATPase [Methylophilus sp. 14]MBF4987174.1 AAA family ATPase [Methylophilus sp. 14]